MFKIKSKAEKKKSKYLCLDLGSYSIKGAIGGEALGKIRIEKVFEELVPNGFYENGQVRDAEELAAMVTQICTKENIKVKDIIITLDSSELLKRELVLPDTEGMNLTESISYELEEELPIDVNDYVLQPRVMEKFEQDGLKKQKVLVAALPKYLIERIFYGLQEGKYFPRILDIHSNGVEKLAKSKYIGDIESDNGIIAMIDLGHKNSNITIIENGEYQFNRILRNGGETIYTSTKEAFDYLSDKELKEVFNMDLLLDPKIGTRNPEAAQMFMDDILAWITDIEKVLAYYGSRSAGKTINRIVLYGGNSRLRNLNILFEKRLGIPTTLLREMGNIDFPVEAKEEMFKYVNVISAIIRR